MEGSSDFTIAGPTSGNMVINLQLEYASKIREVLILYFDDDSTIYDPYYLVEIADNPLV